MADFQAWANALYPPKLLVAATERGRLDAAWLDLGPGDEGIVGPGDEAGVTASPGPTAPSSPGPDAKGWVFPPEVVFDRDRLVALFASFPGLVRAKGVFRTPHDWFALNRARTGEPAIAHTAYRRDSRVEAFADAPDWERFDAELRACIRPSPERERRGG